jgi:hypothetical protein
MKFASFLLHAIKPYGGINTFKSADFVIDKIDQNLGSFNYRLNN